MVRQVLLLAVLLLSGISLRVVQASDATAGDPSGTWAWSYDYGHGEVKSLLTLQSKNKQLTGVYHGDNGKIDVKEGKFDGEQVTFKFDVVRDGQTITVSFAGVPRDDAITGTLSALVDGQTHEFPWKAKRSTRPEDVVGNWKLTINADNGRTYEPEVKIEHKESKLSGRYLTKEVGDYDLDPVALKDNVLKFSVSVSVDGRALKLDYEGKPRGDQLAGQIKYDLDGNTGTTKFTGARAPADAE